MTARPCSGWPPYYREIADCPALIEVPVRGSEANLSRKLAKLVAKTALDAISLGFGRPSSHGIRTGRGGS